MNLYSSVENPFTDKAFFNYNKFKDVVYKAQRLMDDIVDLEEEKINLILNKIENDPEPDSIKSIEKNLWIKIKQKLLDGRRTGLSAIGLADAFAGLNITYGYQESIQLAEEIYKQFAISAYKSSIDMGDERGTFPIWNEIVENNNPFLRRFSEESYKEFKGYYKEEPYTISIPRRNISLLTIPPSGTISMMAGISSGIEPVYQLYYKRRYKILENTEEKKAFDFVDASGDKWREYIVIHPKFIEWCKSKNDGNTKEFLQTLDEETLKGLIELSPYFKSTSYEIDPIQRVKLQGKIQQWIDHSISSTINLPEDTTEEQVSNIYMQAWREGLKGVTIYRNNCRTGVLVDVDKKESKEFKQHNAPKRPKSLPCTVHKVKSRGKEWLVIVGMYDSKPYEVFTLENKFNIQYSEIAGTVSKVTKGRYDLSLDNEVCIENITEDIPDDENLLTRMISTSLRHGSSIEFVVEQLNKSKGDITSFGRSTARVLKRYIPDGQIKSNDLCPECNLNTLKYESGCKTCTNCGYSKCG